MTETSLQSPPQKLRTTYGDEVELKESFSEGATAVLYHAVMNDCDVVVKMAKLGQNDFIHGEWAILKKAREFYKGVNNQPSPYPHGTGKYPDISNGQEFIVMEDLSAGKDGKTAEPALEVVRNLAQLPAEKDRRLSEKQLLLLAADLFKFLNFLHAECKVSYPDFKLDNLWLEKGKKENYSLRVLDLGGLRPINGKDDPECRWDVLVAASHLFTLLMGRVFQLTAGKVTDDMDAALRRMSPEQVSWGTRRFFSRLLSRVPDFRITSAHKAAEDARELFELWDAEEIALSDKCHALSDAADEITSNSGARNEALAKARAGFDIYVKRFGLANPASRESLLNIERKYEATSYLEQGKSALKHERYEVAMDNFRRGETFENNPSLFRCWRRLALLQQQSNDVSLFPKAEQIGDLYRSQRYQDALVLLRNLPAALEKDALLAETEALACYAAGLNCGLQNDHDHAIENFGKADMLLSALSFDDRKAVERQWGDPKQLAETHKTQQALISDNKKYETLYGDLKKKLTGAKISDCYEDIRAFTAAGRYAPNMPRYAEELLVYAYHKGLIEEISFVAETLFWGAQSHTERFTDLYGAARDLAAAHLAVITNNAVQRTDVLERLKSISEKSGKVPETKRHILNMIRRMSKNQYAKGDLDFWKPVEVLLGKLPISDKGLRSERKSLANDLRKGMKELEKAQKVSSQAATQPVRVWTPIFAREVGTPAKRRKQIVPVLAGIGGTGLIIILLGFLFLRSPQVPPPVVGNGTTFTPTSTLTLTATPTVTGTSTSTPTDTPTPLPTSTYWVANLETVVPGTPGTPLVDLPVIPMSLWKLSDSCKPDDSQYCITMDASVPAGIYALYVYDDLQILGSNKQPLLKFNVSFIDSTGQLAPLDPILGSGEVQVSAISEVNTVSVFPKLWIWIGTYELAQTGKLDIKVDVPKTAKIYDPMKKGKFPLILVNVDQTQWNELPAAEGYQLVTILDEASNLSAVTPTPAIKASSGAWNGSVAMVESGLFFGSGVLQAGTYKVFYHVTGDPATPDKMSIKILKGNSLQTLQELQDIAISTESPWLPLGNEFTFELEEPAHIMFNIESPDGSPIPVDAILIYKKK